MPIFGLTFTDDEKKMGLFLIGGALVKNWIDEEKYDREHPED